MNTDKKNKRIEKAFELIDIVLPRLPAGWLMDDASMKRVKPYSKWFQVTYYVKPKGKYD